MSESPLTLVILAAGLGRRFGGLKQLEPVGPSGESLLEYSIFDAHRAGFHNVILVVREETESQFRRRLGAAASVIPVTYAHQRLDDVADPSRIHAERVKPWGTVHAALAARDQLGAGCVLLNADDFYGRAGFERLFRFHVEHPSEAAVVGFPVAETLSPAGSVSRARCVTDAENPALLSHIRELKEVWREEAGIVYRRPDGSLGSLAESAPVSMNMWLLPQAVIRALGRRFSGFFEASCDDLEAECLLPDEIQQLMDQDQLKVHLVKGKGPWCGLTHAADRERARRRIVSWVENGTYPPDLWASPGTE